MAVTIIVFVALVALASAGIINPYAAAPLAYAPLAYNGHYDPHPQYSYGYGVQDALTGDSKSHHETRNGDVVTGSYSVVDPDGTKRTVDYTADPIHGFNAVVHRTPIAFAAPIARVAPLAYASPYTHGLPHHH